MVLCSIIIKERQYGSSFSALPQSIHSFSPKSLMIRLPIIKKIAPPTTSGTGYSPPPLCLRDS